MWWRRWNVGVADAIERMVSKDMRMVFGSYIFKGQRLAVSLYCCCLV